MTYKSPNGRELLTVPEYETLEGMLGALFDILDAGDFSEYEYNFIESIHNRLVEYGEDMFCTSTQFEYVEQIYAKYF